MRIQYDNLLTMPPKSSQQIPLEQCAMQIKKALRHLSYSYAKVKDLSVTIEDLSDEELESWEGFVARFGRVSDLFLARYLRGIILEGDPGFRGTLRDLVDQGEKLGILDSADTWMTIRELRNPSVHEYTDITCIQVIYQYIITRIQVIMMRCFLEKYYNGWWRTGMNGMFGSDPH